MDFQFYSLHGKMAAAGALVIDYDTKAPGTVTNDNGMTGITVFDLGIATARQLWLALVSNLTATGYVDGIFIDKIATVAAPHKGTSTGWALQNRNKASPIVVTKSQAQAYNAGKAQLLSRFETNTNTAGAAWNATMEAIVLKDKTPATFPLKLQQQINKTLSKKHAKFTYAYLKTDDQKTDHDPNNTTSACSDDLLAAFLLAVEERVFLGCNGWDDRFARPLGNPVESMQVQKNGLT